MKTFYDKQLQRNLGYRYGRMYYARRAPYMRFTASDLDHLIRVAQSQSGTRRQRHQADIAAQVFYAKVNLRGFALRMSLATVALYCLYRLLAAYLPAGM